MSELEGTRTFWNASPCGGIPNFEERKARRYGTKPWILDTVERIASEHSHITEIGCGQGTDALIACSVLPEYGSYVGLDYSDESVAIAKRTLSEVGKELRVTPEFYVGNAEALPFEDGTIECVYSLGVLHHTANDVEAFNEIDRVLKPGGKAYIWIYRKWSLKVVVAKLLRLLQTGLDKIFGTDRCIYRLFYGRHFEKLLGTMLLECFGVPYMKWYGRQDLEQLLSRFRLVSLARIAHSLPWGQGEGHGPTKFGYLWSIEIEKK